MTRRVDCDVAVRVGGAARTRAAESISWTALRTACLTGVAHRKMAVPIHLPPASNHYCGRFRTKRFPLTNRMVAFSDADGCRETLGFSG